MISINASSSEGIPFKGMLGVNLSLGYGYVMTIQFKDEKIRVDASQIIQLIFNGSTKNYNGIFSNWLKVQRVFTGKSGSEKENKTETIKGFNDGINAMVESIVKIESSSDQNW